MKRLLLTLMATVFCAVQLLAQTRTIRGRVTGIDGLPVSNAFVIIKGGQVGVTTNSYGFYSLSGRLNVDTLIISSPGFLSQELPISSGTPTFDVLLRRSGERALPPTVAAPLSVSVPNTLDTVEVVLDTAEIIVGGADMENEGIVVVAYGTTEKLTFTGSAGEVNASQISIRPITNVTTVIDGLIPGVFSTSTNGQPASGLNMRIRGFGSINATSEPLLVVDGVPYIGNSSNINAADVENITVLKDAASSALYGSRGGNGVVMITTKKGRKQRNGISVRVLQGTVSRAVPEYDRLDANQYYPIMWEAYRNSLVYPNAGPGISLDSANRVASGLTSRTHIQDLLSYNPFNVANNAIVGTDGELNSGAQLLYGDDLDWTKELLRTGSRGDYSVNLNGGSDKADYYLSLGYLKESGFLVHSDFKRYDARLNVNVLPTTWLRVGLNIAGNHSLSNLAQDSGSTSFVNPFYFTRNMGPIYPVYAHDMTTGAYLLDPVTGQKFYDLGNMGGTLGVPNRTSGAFAGRHALAETTLDEELVKRTMMSARNVAEITFLENFKFINNLSVDYQVQSNNTYDNNLVGDGAPAGRSQKENITNSSFVASQLLKYDNTFDIHHFDMMIGHESFNQTITGLSGYNQGQTVSGSVELGNFTTINSDGSYTDKYKIEGYFTRVNYDYDGKYFLSGSLRRDGNSKFSSKTRWDTFWSFGAGWNLTNEDFMSNIKWVSYLKLRASYGVAGVADGNGTANSIGYYAYQGIYNFANNANEPGVVQSQTQTLMNPNLTWENNKQFDFGLEFSLFKDRLNGSVEYFQRTSSDLLFAVPQPLSSGVLSVIQNAAAMKNSGIELQLSGDVIQNKSFIWNATLNLSTLTNKITEMPETIPEYITGTKRYVVGQSLFHYWLPTYYGVDSADGAALYRAANTLTTANRRIVNNKSGGSDTLTILASNGKFEYHGTAIPDLYGSLGQSFSYKGFTLNVLLVFQLGGKTYDANYQGLMSSGTYGGAVSPDILQRWQKPGDHTSVPRMDAGRTTDFNTNSSRWLIDASYLNIRAASLSYNLPSSWISKWNMSSCQFFLSGENLAFFSKRKGLNNRQDFSGVTFNAYPPARVISAGLILNR
jgi:TonB-linked SusC/RagA family outer membrane protein